MRNILLGTLLCIVGCIHGSTDTVTICSSRELLTIPVLPGAAEGKTFKKSYITTNSDLSEALSKIEDVGDVTVDLQSASFTTKEQRDLSFVRSVELNFVNNDGSLEFLASTDDVSGTSIMFRFNSVPPNVKQALRSGPVKFKTTVSGTLPTEEVTPMLSVCITAQSTIDANVSDIK